MSYTVTKVDLEAVFGLGAASMPLERPHGRVCELDGLALPLYRGVTPSWPFPSLTN